MNPFVAQELVSAHCDAMRRDAAQERLVRAARGEQPALADRMLAGVGDALVAVGARLRSRRERALLHPAHAAAAVPAVAAAGGSTGWRVDGDLAPQLVTVCLVQYTTMGQTPVSRGMLTWTVSERQTSRQM